MSSLQKPSIHEAEFIQKNWKLDIRDLSLKHSHQFINWGFIAHQIRGKQKSITKLPTWFNCDDIIYPVGLSVEQCSSEITAQYKSTIISGESLVDLTGGFGIDDFYFSKKIKQVYHCEIDQQLSDIVAYNYMSLGVNNISCVCIDSADFLNQSLEQFDWIYVDPARRSDAKGKVFLLEDCSPNVIDSLSLYFKHTNNILIKTAPILDLSAGIDSLHFVKNIHIVAVKNEVKEILWEIKKGYTNQITVKTINHTLPQTEIFDFIFGYSTAQNVIYNQPQKYLYEPNAAIMKSGGFNDVALQFNLDKLHPNSHLFTSQELVNFPGRCFEIKDVVLYKKKNLKSILKNKKLNISTRNFNDSVNDLKKKWNIKDGGNTYCFFTTTIDEEKVILFCEKIKNTVH